MSLNAWNPVCIHYLLLCPASLRKAFRLPRTTFVWNVCIQFEYITEAIYWRFAKANSTRGKISMNILWLLCVMSVRHYAIWTAMFWTNSTNAWRYYVILRNNLRWIFAGFLIASWQLLDIFLGLLDDSCKLLPGSWQLFPLPNCQVYSRYTKKPLRHRQEANETQTRLLRYRQEVTRYVKSSRIFLKFSKKFLEHPDLSRIVRKCQEVSRSCSRCLQEDIRKCQDLKFCTILVELRESGTALGGQPEIHQIINTNLTRIKGIT